MSQKKVSAWEKVFAQLENPWDWAAASIGGAAGATVTTVLHGGDLGHSIPVGALGTVGARKAFVASFRRPLLRKTSKSLRNILRQHRYADIERWLDDAYIKWDQRIIDNAEFEKRIKLISDEDSKRFSGIPLKLEDKTEPKKHLKPGGYSFDGDESDTKKDRDKSSDDEEAEDGDDDSEEAEKD